MNSDNPKKQDTSKRSFAGEADDCSTDQKDLEESACETTVRISTLTLEDDALPPAEEDIGTDPYDTA